LLNLGFRRTRSRQYFRRCCRIADERGYSANLPQRMTGSRAASDLSHLMSQMGHSRPDWPARVTSGLAPIPAEELASRIGSFMPQPEMQILSLSQKAYVQLDALDILAEEANSDSWIAPDCPLIICRRRESSKVVASPVRRWEWSKSNEQNHEKSNKRPPGCSRRQRKPVPQRPSSDSAAELAATFIRANCPDREELRSHCSRSCQ
jgi:hypothetical protein